MQLNPFDLVVLLTLSNTVQNAIIGEDNSITGGCIGATSLLIVNYLVVRFLYDHKKLDQSWRAAPTCSSTMEKSAWNAEERTDQL